MESGHCAPASIGADLQVGSEPATTGWTEVHGYFGEALTFHLKVIQIYLSILKLNLTKDVLSK